MVKSRSAAQRLEPPDRTAKVDAKAAPTSRTRDVEDHALLTEDEESGVADGAILKGDGETPEGCGLYAGYHGVVSGRVQGAPRMQWPTTCGRVSRW